MLQVNVEARCTAGQILSHPWVSVSTYVSGTDASVSHGPQRAPSPGLRCRPRSGPTFCGALGVLFRGHAACPQGAAAGTRPLCEGPACPVSAGWSVLQGPFPVILGFESLEHVLRDEPVWEPDLCLPGWWSQECSCSRWGGREPGGGCVKFGECPSVGSASGLGSNTVNAGRA